MGEPTVALAFTPDFWVEELHRHLTDHGGARVRSVVVESAVALEESYDVLIAGHRWPALTRAFVDDAHARGRAVLGVFDRAEPPSRDHLVGLGVDALVESDAAPDAFVRAVVSAAGHRDDRAPSAAAPPEPRSGTVVVVGGAPGTGRTEIAVALGLRLASNGSAALVDADDVAPAIAQRLQLAIEPNVCTAVDAVEHGRGTLAQSLVPVGTLPVLAGLPSARNWAQLRPGEVVRVVDRIARAYAFVVVDGAGSLDELVGSGARTRFATARALVADADVLVAVCDAAPHGIARLLSWCVEARSLAPAAPMIAVVNRAPAERFQRGELYDELRRNLPLVDVAFVPHDARVPAATWAGRPVGRGAFVRAIERLGATVAS